MPEVTRIMIATHQHAGLAGAPGDAHDREDGGAQVYQEHDCLDAARGDAHIRNDVDPSWAGWCVMVAEAGPGDFPEAAMNFPFLLLKH